MRTMEDWEREFLELWNNLLDESATGTQEDILLVSRGKSITVKNNGKPFVLKNSLKESLGKKKRNKKKERKKSIFFDHEARRKGTGTSLYIQKITTIRSSHVMEFRRVKRSKNKGKNII